MADDRERDPGEATPEGVDNLDEYEFETADGADTAVGDADVADVVDEERYDSDDTDDTDDTDDSAHADASDDELDATDGPEDAVVVGARPRRAARTRGDRVAEKKGRATPKQQQTARPARTTPAAFVRESVAELRKVVYPTGSQLLNYFVVVLIFVLFIIAFVSLLDLGFGWLILKVFS